MLFDERQVRDDFSLEWLIILRRMEEFVNQVASNIVHFVHVSMCPDQVSVIWEKTQAGSGQYKQYCRSAV